jgi:hypothetical protein
MKTQAEHRNSVRNAGRCPETAGFPAIDARRMSKADAFPPVT